MAQPIRLLKSRGIVDPALGHANDSPPLCQVIHDAHLFFGVPGVYSNAVDFLFKLGIGQCIQSTPERAYYPLQKSLNPWQWPLPYFYGPSIITVLMPAGVTFG